MHFEFCCFPFSGFLWLKTLIWFFVGMISRLSCKLQKERVSRNRPEPFSKCVGECCQPGKLSIDQKDSEKIAIGT